MLHTFKSRNIQSDTRTHCHSLAFFPPTANKTRGEGYPANIYYVDDHE